jgi:L-malate glycosyltransferase
VIVEKIETRKRRLSIALVHAHADHFFGSERVALDVAIAMRDQGHSVTMFLPEDGPFSDIVRQAGFRPRIIPLRKPSLREFIRRPWLPLGVLVRLRAVKPDLIFSTSLSPVPWMLPAARLLRAPIFAQLQTVYDPDDLRRCLCHFAERLLPITPAVADPLVRHLNRCRAKCAKISLLTPAITPPDHQAPERGRQLRERLEIQPDQILVGMVGQVIQRKGVDLFLQALASLAVCGLRPPAMIVGADPDPCGEFQRDLMAQAESLGLSSQIHWTGQVADVAAHFAALDLVAVPSRREGLGLVAGEAMLGGAAVIAARTGGLPDLVRDGETGLLFESEDVDQFSNALRRVMTDSDLRLRLADSGREFIQQARSPLRFSQDLKMIINV